MRDATMASHERMTESESYAPERCDSTTDCLDRVVDYLQQRGLAPDGDAGDLFSRLLHLAFESQGSRFTVREAGRRLYMSRRTLSRRCLVAGIPRASEILSLGRILRTVHVIRTTGCAAGRAAVETGWPDPYTFSNTMLRMTGLRPSAARERGVLSVAKAWLQRGIAEGTIELRSPGPARCPACGQELVS
jgi:AraC-like DNA-binding protein